jgi:DNA-binding winged helix-turn-helix (wHTH) protein
MAWQEHFNETVLATLLDALRSTGRPAPLLGFGKSEDVGNIPKSLAEVIIDAAEQLWASQHQEGISRLSVSDVFLRLGVSDLNSTFARDLQRSLEAVRDAFAVNDERSITAIVERAKLRREMDPKGIRPVEGFAVDEATFTVTHLERQCKFSARMKLLFSLMVRISRRPGYRVLFDTLRDHGGVWDNYPVEDETIRGAVKRLRDHLKNNGLTDVAAAITTGTYENRGYVLLDFAAP